MTGLGQWPGGWARLPPTAGQVCIPQVHIRPLGQEGGQSGPGVEGGDFKGPCPLGFLLRMRQLPTHRYMGGAAANGGGAGIDVDKQLPSGSETEVLTERLSGNP